MSRIYRIAGNAFILSRNREQATGDRIYRIAGNAFILSICAILESCQKTNRRHTRKNARRMS